MSNEKDFFITTCDNPYNYFTQFDEWLAYDRLMGYFTLEYLGRIIKTSPYLSEEDEKLEVDRAIDSMIEWNGGFYKKVYKP